MMTTERIAASRGDPPASAPRPSGFVWPRDRPAERYGRAARALPFALGWQGWAQVALIALGTLLSLALWLVPPPAGLAVAGQRACAVFLLCTTLWVTNALPVGVTGILAIALLGFSGALSSGDAFAAFGNSAVFFLLGVFILAAALTRSGLSKRCALLFLVKFGRTPYTFSTGMMLTACIATVFMPAQATTAMLFPIAFDVARALKLEPQRSAYGKLLFLSLAWGAMVGSNASFLGSTRAALVLGILGKTHGVTIGFAQWLAAALPLVVLGVLATPLVLRLAFPRQPLDFAAARALLEDAVGRLGPLGWQETRVAAVMLATVAAWVSLGGRVDLAAIALVGGVAMFALGALRWDDAEGRIYWNVILMYGGAMALGVALDRAGAAAWLVRRLLGDARPSGFAIVAGVGTVTLVLSVFMRNAAAIAVTLPLALRLGDAAGVSPVALALASSFGGGLAFALPISSAPNTIAFASGYVKMTNFIRVGTVMTLVSIASLLLVARLWWPLLGVR